MLAGVGIFCGALATFAASAAGTSAAQAYQLDGGDLSTVLGDFAAQSGIQILYDAKLLAGHRSAGLSGAYSFEAALSRLLRDSGLEAVAVNADTFVIKRLPRRTPRSVPHQGVASVQAPAVATELSTVIVKNGDLQRLATQGATPVTEITREQIDSSGYTTLFDLLKAQPGMQVANQPEAMASASDANFRTGAAGAAAVALRRLGGKSTLFLVDGRRVAGYGLAQDATGTVPDLNAIPLAMVERIEILRDGASAIYGSDAIAGVVNILLRHDFAGAEVSTYAGQSSRADAATQQTSALWGGRTEGGVGMLLNVNFLHSDPLLGAERSWYSLDQRRQGLLDLRSPYSFPGNYLYFDDDGQQRIEALPGCRDALSGGQCLLDGAKYTTLQNGKNGKSVLGRLDMPVGESSHVYVDLRATDLAQRQQAAPSGALLLLAQDKNAPTPQPFAQLYSFNDIGPVRETTQSTLLSLDAGASGLIGNWTWGVDASVQRNHVDDAIEGLIRADVLSLGGEPYTFGGAPPSKALRDAISPRVERNGTTTLDDLSLQASGAVFEMPAGTASVATGIEFRHEGIEQQPGEILLAGKLLNQPREFAQSLGRASSAAYIKLDLPVGERVDAALAWRLEDTGGFGAHGSPTLGLRWSPFDTLVLRASASAGYRAPTLLELHQPRSVPVQAIVSVPHHAGTCASELLTLGDQSICVLDFTTSGNPALRPEVSKTTALGAVWAPTAALSVSADIYSSIRDNEIADASPVYVFDHPQQFPDFLVRNDDGQLVALKSKLANLARTTTRGVDAEVRWDIQSENAGTFRLSAGLNYLGTLDRQLAPGIAPARSAGYADNPRLTGVATLRWVLGDWVGGANLRYIGSYALETYADSGSPCPDYKVTQGKCTIPPFSLVNFNLTYNGIAHWAFTGSVNNVFDHAPRYYDEAAGGYNAAFDDALGRYYAVRVTYRF